MLERMQSGPGVLGTHHPLGFIFFLSVLPQPFYQHLDLHQDRGNRVTETWQLHVTGFSQMRYLEPSFWSNPGIERP